MGTNIYLQSDFIEPYDKYLHDPMGEIRWKRLSRGGRNRKDIFKLLYNYVKSTKPLENNVVPHGTVRELYEKYEEREVNGIWNANWDHTGICSSFSNLVIYTDDMAHRGEGKKIVDVENAIEEYPNMYASVLLRNNQNYSISYRELFIGNMVFKLTYISLTDDWRSNCGHVVITYDGSSTYNNYDNLFFTCKLGTHITSPIFAFDYIEIPVETSQFPYGCSEKFYIDFNESPGLPEEVVVRDNTNALNGQCVPFSEIISFKEISQCIKKRLKSES